MNLRAKLQNIINFTSKISVFYSPVPNFVLQILRACVYACYQAQIVVLGPPFNALLIKIIIIITI